ncbi:MAG TPA: flagellar basal body P-ring formation protein FlgA [Gammaproteobacteria bacterium]|nr:flagellar basal body P-ring formation protein FlgA [Gammaproteobacteria bacterium]
MLPSRPRQSVKNPYIAQFCVFNSLLSKEIIFPADTLRMKHIYHLIFTILLLAATGATARELEPVENIRNSVEQYIKYHLARNEDTAYEIGRLDPRLRLDKCDQPLEVFDNGDTRRIGPGSLGVRCRGSKMWKIHVPINIIRYARVLVVRQNLPRGSLLQDSDVELRRLDVTRLNNGYFTSKDEIRGKILKRNLRRGDILTGGMLEIRKLVKRGDIVTIMASSGTLAIRVKGEALMDGRKGDLIRVKNHSSKREIQAVVVATGLVQVNM